MKFESPYADMFQKKPQKGTRFRFEIALDTLADADVIEELVKKANKSEYVRQLIREDIKKRG
jgi:hypothetical protein